MKLTFTLVLISTMLVSAVGYSQSTRLNLDYKKISVGQLLQLIEDQTDYRFAFTKSGLNTDEEVTIDVKDATLDQVLKIILDNNQLTYSIIDRYVIISDKTSLKHADSAQQQKTVFGKVTDSSDSSLPGVSVVIKGTTQGTITDFDGKYSLSDVPANASLMFSFVGMKNQEIVVAGKTSVDVVMEEETIGIEEIVAVGYGTQKKASLTGAISSVKANEIIATKNENVTNMLAGKMAGVRVVQTTGEPGDLASSIQIRGFGSPLVIIDGVPRDNATMSRLDPNEIESISVLKDASASIYGVRAANGVILITTKKGTNGKIQLEYSGYYGVQTPIRNPKGLDTPEYMEIINENNIMRGSVEPGTLVYSLDEIQAYRNGEKTGTDWTRINSNYYAPQYRHNISASGSTENINYFVNFGNLYQEGIYKTGDLNYSRYNLRSNVIAKINKNLKLELLLSGECDTKNSPYGDDNRQQYFRTTWVLKPTDPAYANYNRNYMQEIFQGLNPLAITDSEILGYEKHNRKSFLSTANLIWNIPWVEGLQVKGSYSYDYNLYENKSLQKPYLLYNYDLSNDVYNPSQHGNTVIQGTSQLTRSVMFHKSTLMQGSLTYDRTFSKHHVAGLLVYEQGRSNLDNFSASRYIQMTSIEELFGGITTNQQGFMNGSNFWTIANNALVGRANYDYGSKYYGELSFRYDGSSKFASGHQWGFFPSVSAGWRISEESFFKNNPSLSFIQSLKIRTSFGVTGDDSTATFQYVEGYTYPVTNFAWPVRMFGDEMAAGIKLKDTPNPNLTWMTSKILDIGLDADLWNGLFGFEFDVFKRNRDGLVGSRVSTIPDWLGQSLAQENLNKDATLGFDLSLKHRNTLSTSIGNIQYNVAANISLSRSKNVYVERLESVDQWSNWRNNPTNRYKDIWWGYESTGQFQNSDEIFSSPILDSQGNSNMKPGDYKYEDWNGDGVIDDNDTHPIAKGNQNAPVIFYGTTINAQYKGFDLTAVFQGAALNNVKYGGVLVYAFQYDGNGPDIYYDRWHMEDPTADPKDPNTKWISGTYPTTSQASTAMSLNYNTNSTATIHNAVYLRCKSLELGYTIPKTLAKKVGIDGLRIFGTAYNLLTLTKLKYIDPEHPSTNNGFDYPLVRTINIGVNVKF